MIKLIVSLPDIEDIKSNLREMLPNIKSSHRVEALARGLGFNSNAALRVAAKNPIEITPSDRVFCEYLAQYALDNDRFYLTRACAKMTIRRIMERAPTLTHYGFGIFEPKRKTAEERRVQFAEGRASMLSEGAQDEFVLACEFVSLLAPRKTINRGLTSYGLKHAAEHYLRANRKEERIGHGYVSNGMMIAAALHAGFEARASYPGSPNANFNISQQSLARLEVEKAAA